MRAHLAYFKYVLRHKWYVFVECCKLGIPWLGIIHDLSKFLPSEWFPYVHYFHNPDGTPIQRRNETGYYKPTDTGDAAFDFAWEHHVRHTRHHWQSYVSLVGIKVLPIPHKYRLEMLADWRGAGRAQGTPDTRAWYLKNKHKMRLHPATVYWLERQLGIVGETVGPPLAPRK